MPISESLSVHTSINICLCPSVNNEPFSVSHLASTNTTNYLHIVYKSDLCGDRTTFISLFPMAGFCRSTYCHWFLPKANRNNATEDKIKNEIVFSVVLWFHFFFLAPGLQLWTSSRHFCSCHIIGSDELMSSLEITLLGLRMTGRCVSKYLYRACHW